MTARNACGSLGLVLGTAISNTVVQTILKTDLPATLIDPLVADGRQLTFALIEEMPSLDDPTRMLVRLASARAFQVLFRTMIGLSGVGVIATIFMQSLPLHANTEDDWQLEASQVEK